MAAASVFLSIIPGKDPKVILDFRPLSVQHTELGKIAREARGWIENRLKGDKIPLDTVVDEVPVAPLAPVAPVGPVGPVAPVETKPEDNKPDESKPDESKPEDTAPAGTVDPNAPVAPAEAPKSELPAGVKEE